MLPQRRNRALRMVLLAGAILFTACNRADKKTPGSSAQAFDTLRFEEAAEKSGLNFRHEAGNRGHYYMRESMGSGVALFDYNNDGKLDAYFLNGRPKDTTAAEAGKFRNRLFR